MSYPLVVRPEVYDDLLEAESWYEEQQVGLGRVFLLAVRETMGRLAENPLHYRIRHRRSHIRWAYPKPFPYRIVFRVIGNAVVIYAILHAARHDRHWKAGM